MGPTSIFRLSVRQLERLIRERSRDDGLVVLTDHARVRMRLRHVVWTEVLDVLRMGVLAMPPEPNATKGSLECRMQRYVAGREVAVVAALSDDDPNVVVVTVIEIGG